MEGGGTLSSLQGFRVVMDMVAVISQRLLLPTLPHLRPAKCRYSVGRRLMTSEESRGWHRAGLARDMNSNTPEEEML